MISTSLVAGRGNMLYPYVLHFNARKDSQASGQAMKQTAQPIRQAGRHTGRQAGTWADRRADRQADKQAHTHQYKTLAYKPACIQIAGEGWS